MAQSSEIKSESTLEENIVGASENGIESPKSTVEKANTTPMDSVKINIPENANKNKASEEEEGEENDVEIIEDDDAKPEEGAANDDDLEDGEIETDDDEPIITSVQAPPLRDKKQSKQLQIEENKRSPLRLQTQPEIPVIDLSEKPVKRKSSRKFTRAGGVEDDWAKNIENAIAAALKKDGIEPSRPEFKRRDELMEEPPPKSKSRKRKKRDPEKEKNKKKKHSHEEQLIESDIDENEMLCIRGASPTPMGRLGLLADDQQSQPLPPPPPPMAGGGGYYDSDGSYSSYESEDSIEYRKSYEEKRQTRRNKDRRQRKGSGHRGGGGGGGSEKRRNRDESDGDDCSRNHDGRAQRKLELCKFYLMECCAKKEKCLYMHADFPCKYYYLGMECVYKGNCKFSHGKPLTDQLRNILLKHIETAPKEILGNFRRISRENAINLLNTTHAKLCDEFSVDNTLAGATTTTLTVTTTCAGSPKSAASPSTSSSSFHKQSNSTGNSNVSIEQSTSASGGSIPSLLDMVIKPPPVSPRKDDKDKLTKNDKHRKSRWCDNQSLPNMSLPPPSITSQITTSTTTTSASTPSSFLSLKNLTGVITHEQIDKLESMGIENLEQVSQLTVAQLNTIGLTISQINEIQLNALNIQKLGLINSPGSSSTTGVITSTTFSTSSDTNNTKPLSQDVDMRFPVIGTSPKLTPLGISAATTTTSSTSSDINLADVGIASPEPIPNSGKNFLDSLQHKSKDDFMVASSSAAAETTRSNVVDYSQYLKDAHLDTDKIDLNNISLDKDDEVLIEDEPALQIDESWCPSEDEHPKIETRRRVDDGEENWDDDLDQAPPIKPTTSRDVNENSWDDGDNSRGRYKEEKISNYDQEKSKPVVEAEEEEDWSCITPAVPTNVARTNADEDNWDDDVDMPATAAPAQSQDDDDNWGDTEGTVKSGYKEKEDTWDDGGFDQPTRKPFHKGKGRQNRDDSWDGGFHQPASNTFFRGKGRQDKEDSWAGGFEKPSRNPFSRQGKGRQNIEEPQPAQQDEEENWDDDIDQPPRNPIHKDESHQDKEEDSWEGGGFDQPPKHTFHKNKGYHQAKEESWADGGFDQSPSNTYRGKGRQDEEETWDGGFDQPPSNTTFYRGKGRQEKDESWDGSFDQPPRNPFYQGKQQQYQQQAPNQWGFNMSRTPQCYPPYMQYQQYQQQQQQQQQFQQYYQQQQQMQQQSHHQEPQQPPQQHQQPPHRHQGEQQDEEENWDDDLDHNKPAQMDDDDNNHQPPTMPPSIPMPAIYDPKTLLPPVATNKIDVSSSVTSMMGSSLGASYLDVCGLNQEKVETETTRQQMAPSDPREYRDPRLYKTQLPLGSAEESNIRSPPPRSSAYDMPKYQRMSIYDATPRMLEDDLTTTKKEDKDDMQLPSFMDLNKTDLDLRLPFKRVMTNYIPATEIDGSISSHPPISYKVVEIDIPKPDYSEIRKNVPVSEKTLDPRLRRIFCLKEPIEGESDSSSASTSFLSALSRQSEAEKSVMASVMGNSGPRIDPRRKKESQDMFGLPATSPHMGAPQPAASSSKTLDIRMLLQKSDWYKNLNSKVKIMVNQQLALVSTELKKFHQDPSPNKIFDIQFIVSNQCLQQILTNLGIYIDDYGEVRQLENEGDDNGGGGGGGGMMSMGGIPMPMIDPSTGMPTLGPGPGPMMPMEFMRGPPPMAMQQRFMGGMLPFGPPKPGLLGIAPPGVGFNPFDPSASCPDGGFSPGQGGYDDQAFGGDGGMFGGPGGGGGNFFRSGGNRKNDNGPDAIRRGGNRNFRGGNGGNSGGGGGSNPRNSDRWGGGSGNSGGSGGGNRRNYDNSRGGGGRGGRDRGGADSRRDKS